MTDMKRITISLPQDLDKRILEFQKNGDFTCLSYSEAVRRLVEIALDWVE